MNALPSSSSSTFTFLTQSKNPNYHFKFTHKVPILPLHSPSPCCSLSDSSSSSTTVLDKNALSPEQNSRIAGSPEDSSSKENLVVRRPVTDFSGEDSGKEEEEEEEEEDDPKASVIDEGLARFAKKMPMFEPERMESKERPLAINLDLALYRAKLLARRTFQYDEAESLLKKCISFWPEDGRPYVVLGKILSKQSKTSEAREIYEKGCQATQGENAYIWQKAVQASPKNRYAWHVWGVFEANMGNIDMGRKLLKIGHNLNPRDAVLLQSLALLEYQYSTANVARVLFRRASELNPRHQPVWFAWGWMEWKERNLNKARKLYQKTLSIDQNSETAARCLQAWGVLEHRVGNLSAARRLFKSSLNINSQSYVTWMTWASMEEDQGNSVRAEEIRNLYFQQRTEVVDDASWVMGFLGIFDPAIDSLKRILKLNPNSYNMPLDSLRNIAGTNKNRVDSSSDDEDDDDANGKNDFDLDAFIKQKLTLDLSNLEIQLETPKFYSVKRSKSPRRIWRRSINGIAEVQVTQ
ncbi:protein high chlorophyll fluorescent 107-like isoform X2 [Glycine soja]|uniref:Suppressor of forked domain-containing protein n=2 Tax=Glycine subgen. Soja TaxID=1462606 RepID=K7L3K0_SOYBN|nr:protein high chlorophyll fluorescent 107 isoform X2 [Glycine max]XP_028241598.1 protein high chlorophyll fluorescent 107-like isoform X2 [Glycine soja]RZC04412.1 Protein high chlorophyll fluorescent 107 isoform B [Glycine soja]|eukprot:XP_006584000.1 protein high chlorophyll fluorescent 107 isoform X2 [Glycine max]